MKTLGTKHPMVFGTILFFATILSAGVLSALIPGAGDIAGAFARIIIALILMVLFRDCFRGGKAFAGLTAVMPGLVFAAWNLFYHRSSGISFRPELIPTALICSIAPAMYEEVLFRGILIDRLQKNGQTSMMAMVLSALLFALVHLTNIAGLGVDKVVNVLVQAGYAFVIGLLFAAFRLKGSGIGSLVIVHALIDFTSQIHAVHPAAASIPVLVVYIVILASSAAYAFVLVPKEKESVRQG